MSAGARYLVTRTLFAVVTIFVALTINFVIFRAAPGGDVANIGRIPLAPLEVKQRIAAEFGLDRPMLTQYWLYLKQLAHGNLGLAFADRQPVLDHLVEAVGNTMRLVLPGLTLGVVAGIGMALLAAWRRGGWLDRLGTMVAMALYALPSQWLGLMMIGAFASVLPSGGMSDPYAIDAGFFAKLGDAVEYTLLPAITLSIGAFGMFTMIVRSSLMETLGEDYIQVARAKGLSNWQVIWRHAFPNAMLPTVTLLALLFGASVSGAILVEAVFSWPGMGRLMQVSIAKRDYPTLQGAFLLVTICVVLANYAADLVYFRLDPRTRVR